MIIDKFRKVIICERKACFEAHISLNLKKLQQKINVNKIS